MESFLLLDSGAQRLSDSEFGLLSPLFATAFQFHLTGGSQGSLFRHIRIEANVRANASKYY
jgi:hypothetical protein